MNKPLAPHPEAPPGLTPPERKIQALIERQNREPSEASVQQRIADAITGFIGSMMTFVYLHLSVFGFWIAANLHMIPAVPAWDESFVVLAVAASVEAIFLSTFVLISQNRLALTPRSGPNWIQVSFLTEHEITMVVSC